MNKTAVISDGSSSLGYEFAKAYLRKNYDVLILSSNKEKLKTAKKSLSKLSSSRILSLHLDLSTPFFLKEIESFLEKKDLQPSLLINNAELGYGENLQTASLKKIKEILDVNITALSLLTKFFADTISARNKSKAGMNNQGLIINIASFSGFFANSQHAVYAATKAYVISFSEALAHEYKDDNIRFLTLCPNMHPSAHPSAHFNVSVLEKKHWFSSFAGLLSGLPYKLSGLPYKIGYKLAYNMSSPKQVVESSLAHLRSSSKKSLVIHGRMNKLTLFLARFLPRQFITKRVAAQPKFY